MAAGHGLAGEGVAEAVGLNRRGGTMRHPAPQIRLDSVYLDGFAREGRGFVLEAPEVDALWYAAARAVAAVRPITDAGSETARRPCPQRRGTPWAMSFRHLSSSIVHESSVRSYPAANNSTSRPRPASRRSSGGRSF